MPLPLCGMKQLEERHVPTTVLKMEWSNKIDLLAIAKEHGEVSLHRLTWQRVWSLAAPKDNTLVTAMAWRPDGKQLAVAYDSHDLLLVDVENKDVTFSKVTEGIVTCMVWVQQENPQQRETIDTSLIEIRGIDYLPKLPNLVMHDTPEEENKIPKVQDTLNLLLVAMGNYTIEILALGTFSIGTLKKHSFLDEGGTVLNMYMPVDFSHLYVAIQSTHGKVIFMPIKIECNESNWNDVYDLASKHDQLLSSLNYLDQTMKNILETWENVSLMEMELKLSSYCPENPLLVSTDLLELLIFGILSERMDQFLKKDLTNKSIKKIGMSIESSHTNVQKLVVRQLSEVTNQILFQLVEISGMPMKNFEELGLTKRSVEKALKAAEMFLMKCNEVQIVIQESMTRYKLFFKWLYGMMIKLNDENPSGDSSVADTSQQELNMLAEYIHSLGESARVWENDYKLDRVGQYFLDANLLFPCGTHNQWWSLMEYNPCLEENVLMVPAQKNTSLMQQFNKLRNCLVDLCEHPKSFLSNSFKYCQHMVLDKQSSTDRVHKVTMVDLPNTKVLVCVVDQNAFDFGFYEMEVNNPVGDLVCRNANVFYMSDKTKQTVYDIQFYSPDHLSVLTETVESSNRNSLFLQLSTSMVRRHCTNDGLAVCRIGGVELDAVSECGDSARVGDGGGDTTGEDVGDSNQRVVDYTCRIVENMSATSFAVSGTRKVAVLLSHSRHKVRLFEMEVDDEDDEEEDSAMDVTRDSSFAD